jgi:hypothetical protein
MYNRAQAHVCQREKHPNQEASPVQYSDNIYFSVFIFCHVLPFCRSLRIAKLQDVLYYKKEKMLIRLIADR